MKNSALVLIAATISLTSSAFVGAGGGGAVPEPRPPIRGPVGIYAVVPLEKAITNAQIQAYYPDGGYNAKRDTLPPYPNPSVSPDPAEAILVDYFGSLLANPAVAGLNVRVRWSTLNPPDPSNPAAGVYTWTALDDAFDSVNSWNTNNPTQLPKTIQLDVVPGFWTPSWVLQLPGMASCDGLFAASAEYQGPSALPPPPPLPDPSSSCGYATFTNSEGQAHDSASPLPLPWSPIYKGAWHDFLEDLNAHLQSYPTPEATELVSIAVAGPTASSPEMILPNSNNDPLSYKWNSATSDSGAPTDAGLLANFYGSGSSYQNSDRAFIEEWEAAIDMFGGIFSDITLITTTGDGLPNFDNPDPALTTPPPGFEPDCASAKKNAMNCAAEATILAYFAEPAVGGTNAKATQTSGVIASRTISGFMGQVAVKWLAGSTAAGPTVLPGGTSIVSRMLGGMEFDTSFSSTDGSPQQHMQHEGCPNNDLCTITPEQALFNVLQTVFTGTAAGDYYGEPKKLSLLSPPKAAPFNYLQIYDTDIVYATANACAPGGSCTQVSIVNILDGSGVDTLSAQAELDRARRQILKKVSEPTVLPGPQFIFPKPPPKF